MSDAAARRPQLGGVLETVLYYDDQDAAERFYSDVLGMRLLGKEPGRSLFYRAGPSVYLLFDAQLTSRPGHTLPPHGARGCVHTCFVVAARDDYERWKRYLVDVGVEIISEVDWPRGGKSFYFHDPAKNLLEIANQDIWPA